jgi:hypothetical protein
MNFSEVLDTIKGPALALASTLIPGGPAILSAVNAFLPAGKKLPATATGADIHNVIQQLSPEQRASLMEKEIDFKIAEEEGWTERYTAMCAGDSQSTRPKIALMMAYVTCFVILLFTIAISAQIFTDGLNSLADSAQAWTVFATLLGIPSSVLAKYFGELRKEQANRLGATNGLATLVKAIKN